MRKAAMVKIVRLVKKRPDLTLAQFKDYWLNEHARHERLAVERTPLRKVVASIATGEVALGGIVAPFDGMVALYFRSVEEARTTFAGPAMAAARADAVNFVAPEGRQVFADEYLMSEKADAAAARPGQLKIFRTVARRRDLGHSQFKDYWLENHSRLEDRVIRESPVQRIVATFALPQAGVEPDFDGMVELYFDSLEGIRSTFAGPVPAMMRKDEENFVQMDAPAVRLVAEEYLIGEKTA